MKSTRELLRLWGLYQQLLFDEDGDLYLQYEKPEKENGKMDEGFFRSFNHTHRTIWMYHGILRRALEPHQFIGTDTGYAGWAPRITGNKYILVIIAGMRIPVILQPVCDSSDFVLLGPCYIHGSCAGRHAIFELEISGRR